MLMTYPVSSTIGYSVEFGGAGINIPTEP